MPYVVFFFFFQAEDGIRDFHVTGVQTCALPISGLLVAIEPDFWVPATMIEQVTRDSGRLTNRQAYWLLAVGRLKPGVDATRARTEMNRLAGVMEQDHPDTNKNLGATVFPAALVPGPYR